MPPCSRPWTLGTFRRPPTTRSGTQHLLESPIAAWVAGFDSGGWNDQVLQQHHQSRNDRRSGDADTSASALALVDYNCYPASPSLGLSPNGSPTTRPRVTTSWAHASSRSNRQNGTVATNPMFWPGTGAARKLQSKSLFGQGIHKRHEWRIGDRHGSVGKWRFTSGLQLRPGSVVPARLS
jgi:hypothetical protein